MMAEPVFALRTPCMDNPTKFDFHIDGETAAEANVRMAEAAQICKRACPELASCREHFLDSSNRPPGVVAGEYRSRSGYDSEWRRTQAAYGRYKEGDACLGCGMQLIIDPEVDLPEGWARHYRSGRCRSCYSAKRREDNRAAKSRYNARRRKELSL